MYIWKTSSICYRQALDRRVDSSRLNTNPVSRDSMLMRTNVNLLNRVPEHDCPTIFVLQRTKCKPMHLSWERFSDVFMLHRTKCKQMCFELERFSDERERERVRTDSTVDPLVICQYFRFLSRPPQKLKRTCSTEQHVNCLRNVRSVKHVRFSF